MGTGVPIFRQVEVTIVVAENDTPIKRSNPAILAPQLLWLSTETQALPAQQRTQARTRKKATKLQMND